MFETLKNVFRVKEMRRKLLYLIWMIFIIRIGCQIPVPGVDSDFFKQWFSSNAGDAFNFFDAFTGGSFESMSVFALNITPYITSSIIIQLLTIAIPALEEMHRDGEEGRKKMTAITRYVTVGLALFESIAMTIGFSRGNIVKDMNFLKAVVVIASLTAGSAMLMWIGERITEKGVGNGISIVLAVNIVSRIPSDMTTLYENFIKGKTIAKGMLAGVIIFAIIMVVVVFVLILNGAERRIPVQYSKKMVGRKMMGGQSTHMPIKVNMSGVLPVIFASSILSLPGTVQMFLSADKYEGTFWEKFFKAFQGDSWWYAGMYFLLIIFFAYFYSTIQYNPIEMANNLRKNNGAIPGIRPGKPTSDYILRVLSRLTLIGALMLSVIALFPIVYSLICDAAIKPLTEGGNDGGMTISLGGTSLIIMCGVALETVRQLESQMMMRHYKGFLD